MRGFFDESQRQHQEIQREMFQHQAQTQQDMFRIQQDMQNEMAAHQQDMFRMQQDMQNDFVTQQREIMQNFTGQFKPWVNCHQRIIERVSNLSKPIGHSINLSYPRQNFNNTRFVFCPNQNVIRPCCCNDNDPCSRIRRHKVACFDYLYPIIGLPDIYINGFCERCFEISFVTTSLPVFQQCNRTYQVIVEDGIQYVPGASLIRPIEPDFPGMNQPHPGITPIQPHFSGINQPQPGIAPVQHNVPGMNQPQPGISAVKPNFSGVNQPQPGVTPMQPNLPGINQPRTGITPVQHNFPGMNQPQPGITPIQSNSRESLYRGYPDPGMNQNYIEPQPMDTSGFPIQSGFNIYQ
eukprot:TRINITY_DN2752_c0_g1_i1.p1 TRINITY_DN2752_c0_g1~~TRINITY_DN2752_c0_g1_i1.p1  ORF type:complete len:359 (+),score=87.53 TRINITY_DN2752_c0_g1_i1:29-1078(+)